MEHAGAQGLAQSALCGAILASLLSGDPQWWNLQVAAPGLVPSPHSQRPGFCMKSLKGWSGVAQSFVYLLVPSAHPAATVPATNLSTRTTQTMSTTQSCHSARSQESRLLKNWFLLRSRELANLTSETGQTSPTPLNVNIRGNLITETPEQSH